MNRNRIAEDYSRHSRSWCAFTSHERTALPPQPDVRLEHRKTPSPDAVRFGKRASRPKNEESLAFILFAKEAPATWFCWFDAKPRQCNSLANPGLDKLGPGNCCQHRPKKHQPPRPPLWQWQWQPEGLREGNWSPPIYLFLLEVRLLIPDIWVSVPTSLKSANLISPLEHR